MIENQMPRPVKLMISVVDRGKGEHVYKICRDLENPFSLICLGKGTARSDILDMLGIGETQKDVVFTVVREENAGSVVKKLSDLMEFSKPGNGIAFTVPITSVGGIITLNFISGLLGKETDND